MSTPTSAKHTAREGPVQLFSEYGNPRNAEKKLQQIDRDIESIAFNSKIQ